MTTRYENRLGRCLPLTLLTVFLWAGVFKNDADAQARPGVSPPAQRDPTVPSAEIQRRTRTRPTTPQTRTSRVTTPPPARVIRRPVTGDSLALQSLIQSNADSCTATIKSGDETVTVTFVRGMIQREVQLPGTQFADFASTVQRLSAELRQLRTQMKEREMDRLNEAAQEKNGTSDSLELIDPTEALSEEEVIAQATAAAEAELLEVERQFMRQALQPQSIDLASSFSLGGNLYRIIDFNSNTLLLEQVPLGKYVIVR
ncbi:MAG: hypothetical protein AAF802_12235 [Planctomycetota bacterium]